VRPQQLQQSLEACQQIVRVIEGEARYVNLSPKGEPRLGKRGLYDAVGGRGPAEREHALLWVLNQSDGTRSLLEIARRSGMSFGAIEEAANALTEVGLLRPLAAEAMAAGKGPRTVNVPARAARRAKVKRKGKRRNA
jgi:aminopeptidase-like protein